MFWAAMKEKRESKTEGERQESSGGASQHCKVLGQSTFFHIHPLHQPLAGKCSQADLFSHRYLGFQRRQHHLTV